MREFLLIGSLVAFPDSALACEYAINAFKLPSESIESADARAQKRFEQTGLLIMYRQQLDMFQHSQTVYVAIRVSEPGDGVRLPETDDLQLDRMPTAYVRPVAPIKGELPSTDLRLIDNSVLWGGTCSPMDDGFGSSAKIGDPLIVFEGLEAVPHAKGRHARDLFTERADRLVLYSLEKAIASYLADPN